MNMLPVNNLPGFNGGVMPSVLDNANLDLLNQYVAAAKGQGKSIYALDMYDSIRIKGGTAVALGTKRTLFKKPVQAQEVVFNSTETYQKSYTDTNYPGTDQGLPDGQMALVYGIATQVFIPGEKPATASTSGDNVTLPTVPGTLATVAASDAFRAYNVWDTLDKSLYQAFVFQSVEFDNGRLSHFPCPFGPNGVGTGILGTAAQLTNETGINNWNGEYYNMLVWRYLPSLKPFGINVSVQNGFTPPCDLLITFHLFSLYAKDIVG